MVGTPRRLLSSSVAVALLLAACGTSTANTGGKQPTGQISRRKWRRTGDVASELHLDSASSSGDDDLDDALQPQP